MRPQAEDLDPRHIFRKRAAGSAGVTLSVGRDGANAEHVLQVIFDEDLWNPATAHDYLLQHHYDAYQAVLAGGV